MERQEGSRSAPSVARRQLHIHTSANSALAVGEAVAAGGGAAASGSPGGGAAAALYAAVEGAAAAAATVEEEEEEDVTMAAAAARAAARKSRLAARIAHHGSGGSTGGDGGTLHGAVSPDTRLVLPHSHRETVPRGCRRALRPDPVVENVTDAMGVEHDGSSCSLLPPPKRSRGLVVPPASPSPTPQAPTPYDDGATSTLGWDTMLWDSLWDTARGWDSTPTGTPSPSALPSLLSLGRRRVRGRGGPRMLVPLTMPTSWQRSTRAQFAAVAATMPSEIHMQ